MTRTSAVARALTRRLVSKWARSGDLTHGEAEALMALDESTPWSV